MSVSYLGHTCLECRTRIRVLCTLIWDSITLSFNKLAIWRVRRVQETILQLSDFELYNKPHCKCYEGFKSEVTTTWAYLGRIYSVAARHGVSFCSYVIRQTVPVYAYISSLNCNSRKRTYIYIRCIAVRYTQLRTLFGRYDQKFTLAP